MTAPTPEPVDFSTFTDDQVAALLNVPGAMYHMAARELGRRHPLTVDTPDGTAPATL